MSIMQSELQTVGVAFEDEAVYREALIKDTIQVHQDEM